MPRARATKPAAPAPEAGDREIIFRSIPRHPERIRYAVERVPGRKADVIKTFRFVIPPALRQHEREMAAIRAAAVGETGN